MLSLRYGVGKEENYESEDYNALQSPVWGSLAEKYNHIEMMEPEMMVHTNYRDSFSLAQYAVKNDMTISNFAAARPTVETRKRLLEEQYKLLEADNADENTLYIFGNAFEIMGKDLNLNMYVIDGIIVGSKNEIVSTSEDDNIEQYDNTVYKSDFSTNMFSLATDVEEENGVVQNDGNKSEYILYGPYVSIGDGVYDISFELSIVEGEGIVGFADIVSDEGSKVYGYKEINAEDKSIKFDNVTLQDVANLEIRIYINEGCRVKIENFECKLISDDIVEYSPYFSDRKLIYNIMSDKFYTTEGSEKKYDEGYIINDGKTEGAIVYGPYISLPAGKYTVSWEYSVEECNADQVGYIDIAADKGIKIIDSKLVDKSENQITMTFELEKSMDDIELRFIVNKGNVVKINNITLEAADIK